MKKSTLELDKAKGERLILRQGLRAIWSDSWPNTMGLSEKNIESKNPYNLDPLTWTTQWE